MRVALDQLEFIDRPLRQIALSVEAQFGVEFTITCLSRIGDDGVHGTLPLRGIDMRCWDTHFGKLCEDYVNSIWEYDPERPELNCCLAHDSGKGYHIHLQTHPNTRLR